MTPYKVLARKYRPQNFFDVVGQAAIVATLKNSIRMQRTAHACLFCGSKGTGKTTLARLFAKALNCASLSDKIEPCNACPSCKEIAAAHALDVLEIDGASHRGIEDIRQINETVAFAPTGKFYKIYIIDEVHMLTKEAFNALLKTLEEPPSHAKFFFCTTEPHKIPPTILSRCQRFNLNRISQDDLEMKLSKIANHEKIKVEADVLKMIAKKAEGSLRDALSLFDQIIAFETESITVSTVLQLLGLPSKDLFFSLDQAGVEGNLRAAFKIADAVFASGVSLSYFLEELIDHFRILLLAKQGSLTENCYKRSATYYQTEQLIQILDFLIESQHNMRSISSEKTSLEMLLIKIIHSHKQISLADLVDRLCALEKQLSISEDINPRPEELPQKKSPPPASKNSLPVEKILIDQKSENESAVSESQNSSIIESGSLHKKEVLISNEQAKIKLPMPERQPGLRPSPSNPTSIHEQSRYDTIMRFAAKELNASLKKE